MCILAIKIYGKNSIIILEKGKLFKFCVKVFFEGKQHALLLRCAYKLLSRCMWMWIFWIPIPYGNRTFEVVYLPHIIMAVRGVHVLQNDLLNYIWATLIRIFFFFEVIFPQLFFSLINSKIFLRMLSTIFSKIKITLG